MNVKEMLDIRDGKEKIMLYKNYVNGKWIDCELYKVFENTNPADITNVIGNFQDSGAVSYTHLTLPTKRKV